MIRPKWILFLLVARVAWCGRVKADWIDRPPARRQTKVEGIWRFAWNVRLGTVRGILVLKQSGDRVTGTFQEYGHTYSLAGSIQGQSVTFEIPFPGSRPYTIEFKGAVDSNGDEIRGTSELKGGGGFLGHGGEVEEPERPWTATKGLKRPNNTPDQRPDEDDDHR
jgi:hypothetical protein